MRLLSRAIVLFLFILLGCVTFKVEDTTGIKSMFDMRVKAERLKSEVKERYKSSKQKDISKELKKLYDEVYDKNNGWIDGLKLDVQSKDVFKVSKNEYVEHLSGLAAVHFINKAEEALKTEKSLIMIEVGVEAGKFVSEIINNIQEQHNKEVEAARKRIYEELEKAKWQAW